jgi:hypothetical protein
MILHGGEQFRRALWVPNCKSENKKEINDNKRDVKELVSHTKKVVCTLVSTTTTLTMDFPWGHGKISKQH